MVYRVVRESEAQSRFEGAVSAGLTPLIGRDHEVGLLLERWTQAKGGAGLCYGENTRRKNRRRSTRANIPRAGAWCAYPSLTPVGSMKNKRYVP
jgi:hypothetical protein